MEDHNVYACMLFESNRLLDLSFLIHALSTFFYMLNDCFYCVV